MSKEAGWSERKGRTERKWSIKGKDPSVPKVLPVCLVLQTNKAQTKKQTKKTDIIMQENGLSKAIFVAFLLTRKRLYTHFNLHKYLICIKLLYKFIPGILFFFFLFLLFSNFRNWKF